MKKRIFNTLSFLFLFSLCYTVNAQSFVTVEESVLRVSQQTLAYELQLNQTNNSDPAYAQLNKELQSLYVVKENLGNTEPVSVAVMNAVIAYSGYSITESQYNNDDFQNQAIADWRTRLIEIFSK